MARQAKCDIRSFILVCTSFLLWTFSAPAVAASSSLQPGNYCPGNNVLLVAAEELSTSLDLVFRSRAALLNQDYANAVNELRAAGTVLHLAASRGAAARTILLIDAIMQDRTGADYAQMLTWFPLLHTSLNTLPNDPSRSSANDFIADAEAILQHEKDGDPMKPLREARHMLACDELDIPLQQAMKAHAALQKQLNQTTKINAFDTLITSLHSALVYTLKMNVQ